MKRPASCLRHGANVYCIDCPLVPEGVDYGAYWFWLARKQELDPPPAIKETACTPEDSF